MNLLQLQYFVTTAESGSLTKASAELSISQPALSRSIRQLEEYYAVRLFERTGRGVELTENGQRLYQHATTILNQVEQASHDFRAERKDSRRGVVLGLPASVARTHLVPIVADFLREFPDVVLRILEAYSRHLIEAVNDGAVDVAIMYSMGAERDFRNEPLFEEPVSLICRHDSPYRNRTGIEFRELKDFPLILPRPRNAARIQVEFIAADLGIVLRPSVELDSLDATKDLIIAGFGCGILQRSVAEKEIESGLLIAIPIIEPSVMRKLVLVTSTKYRIAPEAEALMRIVRARVRTPMPAPADLATASVA